MQNLFQLVGKINFLKSFVAQSGESENWVGKNVLCVAGDLGGWHATALVLSRLADAGAIISVIFTGPSRRAYEENNLEIDERFRVEVENIDALGAIHVRQLADATLREKFDVIVVSPSQSKDGNNETATIVNRMSTKIPVCVIEDMWGSAVPFLKKINDDILKRTTVCVVDQFAKKMLLERSGIKAKKLFVTGGPQFDRVLELRKNWNEQRNLIRRNMADDAHVYLVAGGVNGTDEILDLVRPVLRPQDVIIFRQHSRSTAKDRKLSEKMIETIKKEGGKFLEVDKKIAPYTESLLAGSDFVLSGFSTTNRYAIILGIAGTIYVGTKSFKKDLWAEKKLKLPPEAEFGAGWYVKNAKEMKAVVEDVVAPVAGKCRKELIKKQQKIAQFCDGKATERVIRVIEKIIKT